MKTKSKNTKNITKMTKAKHKFDGFSIRIEKHGYRFQQYLGAAKCRYSGNEARRFATALKDSLLLRDTLQSILADPKNWGVLEDTMVLKHAVMERIKKGLGFKLTVK